MSKYQNSKIYAIRNTIDNDIYIGSTTTSLCQRMTKHRSAAKTRPSMQKVTAKMNELGVDNFYIELIENFPCENVELLRKREGELIRELGTLNSRIERRTSKEWREENKDIRKEKREKNRDEILKYKKEYREKNRETINKKRMEFYEKNKDIEYQRCKEWKSTKVECQCGGKYTLAHKAEHEKSKKHQQYIQQCSVDSK